MVYEYERVQCLPKTYFGNELLHLDRQTSLARICVGLQRGVYGHT